MPSATQLKNLINQFIADLKTNQNRTPQTVSNYGFYLNRFLNWSKIDLPEQINPKLIGRYKMWLAKLKGKNNRFLQEQTINYHLIALRVFLKYLKNKGFNVLAPQQITLANLPSHQIGILNSSDLQKFLSAPEQLDSSSLIKLRDKAILELLYSTGLKVAELAALKKSDLNLTKDKFIFKNRKNKSRTLPLSNQSSFWLKKYLATRPDKSEFLFTNHDKAASHRDRQNSQGLTPRSIQRLVQRYAKLSGLEQKITPQVLRHTFAANLIKSGTDSQTVQNLLGNSSPTFSQIYADSDANQLSNAYKNFHGSKRNNKKAM